MASGGLKRKDLILQSEELIEICVHPSKKVPFCTRLRRRRVVLCLVVVYVRLLVCSLPRTTTGI